MSAQRLQDEKKSQVLVELTNTQTGNTKQIVTSDDYQSVTQEVVMFATVEGISARDIDIEISQAQATS
ncbi:MAG: hypothetical protein OER96_02775 [Gammaproteobacteria bacterium]|nr:hypothetical protein [Gammaproteobacteria bacterium]